MTKPKISLKSVREDVRYLRLLGRDFPTVSSVTTEIINLEAILHLPKPTEHFWQICTVRTRRSGMSCAMPREISRGK